MSYAALTDHLRQLAALEQVAGLLNWDQETQMPVKGEAQRAEQAGAVAAAIHALATDPRLADWLASDAPPDIGPAGIVNRAEAARLHARATRIPVRLATEIARAAADGQGIWERARAANSYPDFAPALAHMIALKRDEAAHLAEGGRDAYDALLDDFEPGMRAAELAAIFDRLRAGLTDLRARIADTGRTAPTLTGHFPQAAQLALARRIGTAFGYDWDAGRLDLATHPSSSGTGGDVRITTRIDETDPLGCLYSTLHEVGHAVYEQGLDPAHLLLPAGAHASMGVHESQSRLFENQLGRSRAFAGWLHAAMTEAFGAAGVATPDDLYAAINAVETGFIRTEADEIHYNLHVMLRFDLERDLILGHLAPADLEAAWNDRFARDFGRTVPDARRGVLQDVHWSAGLFGYFPTYTLGNVYAAGLHDALRHDIPDLDAQLAQAETAPILAWLRERVHRRGRLLAPRAIIAAAIGAEPDAGSLLGYLEAKYTDLYGL